ncbi:hypothetical protein MYX77_08855 [Acidobacteriia bacterium AH_259_A11_L15]|nr:hypothetical protein [Acidobacteriia bacterium AH_259_A11_L15]
MTSNSKSKLTRRQFAGAVAAGLAAPGLFSGALAQEKKEEKPGASPHAQQQGESFLERGRRRLREFPVPAETEPAFIFRVK